ncbi:antibiotic biosynthesis monooxygenase [Aquibacillus koreensis]|uniref:Antibiotic biosynthesis monooxygenase n=1 Tax=Aquibacillus koreensis TaxID=279446 RepID=A0A9X4AGW7_9BACI|nr:antibiotic biosynthesis monooxygenase family protein [Aquibacillus koreensis]MCT2536546.1 antibiotic biosynthesis monooxygenase [Aquibacillus koreensis]MDC3419366.1 antibiotic biosynthesis monooxygenase [Aquibacillus koreensis]
MYVVMNEHFVPKEEKQQKASRYAQSPERMKDVPGCLEFMFLNEENDGKQIVYTKWESKEAYLAWREGEGYHTSHAQRLRTKVEKPGVFNEIHQYEVVHHYTENA